MMVGVSVAESLVCLGSGSSPAASVEVAFLAACLCFEECLGIPVFGVPDHYVSVATASHGADKI